MDAYRIERERRVDKARRIRNQRLREQGIDISRLDGHHLAEHVNALLSLGWSTAALVAINGAGTREGLGLIAKGRTAQAERKWQPLAEMQPTVHVPPVVPGSCLVPTLGAARRVRGLLVLGWRHQDIADHGGRRSAAVAQQQYPCMRADDWRRIDAAFEALSAKRGPSKINAGRAIALGYFPPLAWDDIDDPNEVPYVAEEVRTIGRPNRTAERIEDVEFLTDQGGSLLSVSSRLGLDPHTLRDTLRRAGRQDVYWRLVNREPDAEMRRKCGKAS